jgi:AcrR family transcriptional regulator
VTHQRVAERTGISRPTIYRHWSSQTQLILSAIEFRPSRVVFPPEASIRDRLVMMLESLCDELESPISVTFMTLVARAEWEPEVREALHRRIGRAASMLGEILADGAPEGELSSEVALERALSLLAGPFFFERIVAGHVRSRESIAAHVDDWLQRWLPGADVVSGEPTAAELQVD